MLWCKLLLPVKTVFEHIAISNFLTYLGTNPFSVFVRNHNIVSFMTSVIYKVWKHPRNVENGSLTHFCIQELLNKYIILKYKTYSMLKYY